LLNSQRRQRSIGEQGSASLGFNRQFFQNVRVPRPWLDDYYASDRKLATNDSK
jgi:hypothetical protein